MLQLDMNRASRAIIERLRQSGFQVRFQINADASIAVTAISPAREAFIVQGRLCDDARLIRELATMVGLDSQSPANA